MHGCLLWIEYFVLQKHIPLVFLGTNRGAECVRSGCLGQMVVYVHLLLMYLQSNIFLLSSCATFSIVFVMTLMTQCGPCLCFKPCMTEEQRQEIRILHLGFVPHRGTLPDVGLQSNCRLLLHCSHQICP